MTSTTWISAASTDFLVSGGVDVRTGGLIMAGPAAQHERTGVPTGVGSATGVVGGAAGSATSRVASALDRRPKSPSTAERFLAPTYLPQNDGTTLGIRSPGRPLS